MKPARWYETWFRLELALAYAGTAVVIPLVIFLHRAQLGPFWVFLLLALFAILSAALCAVLAVELLMSIPARRRGVPYESLSMTARIRPPFAKCVLVAVVSAPFTVGCFFGAIGQVLVGGNSLLVCIAFFGVGAYAFWGGLCGALWAWDLKRQEKRASSG